MKNPGKIRNKIKRTEVFTKYKQQKKNLKKKLREEHIKEVEALGEAPIKQVPKTIENLRVTDETYIQKEDDEINGDERDDEFAPFYSNQKRPKIMITTRPKCSRKLFPFIGDLMQMIPNAFYYPRGSHQVKEICRYATNKLFTHVIILAERGKVCEGFLLIQLTTGPTAFYRLSSFQAGSSIPGHGRPTSHVPEIILNNFNTRLGRRVGRFFGSLFPHEPQLEGRQVVTFHNQRDFIFVRHHRYVYQTQIEKVEKGKDGKAVPPKKRTRARLQELGPRFTLRMKWLMDGEFDPEHGEYEWIHRRKEMDGDKRKFYL